MTAVRLSDLTPDQRRLVLALIDAKAAADTLREQLEQEAHTCHKQGCAGRRFDDHSPLSSGTDDPRREDADRRSRGPARPAEGETPATLEAAPLPLVGAAST